MTTVSTVTVRVPAKVNLQLSVGPAREDGYHDLVNVFHAVSLVDEVTVQRLDSTARVTRTRLHSELDVEQFPDVPLDHTNLAARAAGLLTEITGHGGPVDIELDKTIPVAGGMAGGSADAAGALLACATLWETGLTAHELTSLASSLGSDVPFALLGHTAVGRGRGEHLTPVPCATTLHWVFALAHGGLSAAAVYRAHDHIRPDAPPPTLDHELMTALDRGDLTAVGRALHNDLQPAALALRPDLESTLRAGTTAGALAAIVSGSGPTCAFLAQDAAHARELAAALDNSGTSRSTVCAHGPVPGATIVSP